MQEENKLNETNIENEEKQCPLKEEDKTNYTDVQHYSLLKHIGAEDRNFFLIMLFALGLGGMLFWQIIQIFNLIEISQNVRNLEEPMIIVLMVGLIGGYFYQKNNVNNSEFIDIINKNYYVHRVLLKNKNLIMEKNSFQCEIFVEEYDDKFIVEKNVYDALTPNSYVDIIYSNQKHDILYIVPIINE